MAAAREMIRRYENMEEAPASAAAAESARVEAAGERPQWLADVYVDDPGDTLCRAYHALPERLYALQGPVEGDSVAGSDTPAVGCTASPNSAAACGTDGPSAASCSGCSSSCARVVFQGGEGPFGYSLTAMAAALERHCGARMDWPNMSVQ